MPIDIDQLKLLVKFATAVPQDKGSQAMAAAAQAAKPAGGIPLPKTIEEESPAEGALSAEQQQREQEKLEQQRRKELEAKENEIRGLQHELDLERVERQKMTNRHELDMQVRQEEARLKAEKDKLEKERFQLVQEKARQDNLFKAEEMKHQATLDKATYKQEAEIAKAQAKSTADLAKQQAQSLIATNDKARKASDKYYADASARLTKEHPSISPALQSQLDGAIASLNRFRKVHNKQTAIPKPGTPPDFTKLAMVKWAEYDIDHLQAILGGAYDDTESDYPSEPMDEDTARGVVEGGSAYDAIRAAAYYTNLAAQYSHSGDTDNANYYTDMAAQAKRIAKYNYDNSTDKGDRALYEGYLDTKSTINGFASHKDYHTEESQFDRDAGAFKDELARKKYEAEGGPSWYNYLYDWTLGAIYSDAYNGITDAAAGYRNAERYGANRFWNTTFDNPELADEYYRSIAEQGYSDSATMDYLGAAAGVAGGALSVLPAAGAVGNIGKLGLRGGLKALMTGGKAGVAAAGRHAAGKGVGGAVGNGVNAAARGAGNASKGVNAATTAGNAAAKVDNAADAARATNKATGAADEATNAARGAAAQDVQAAMGNAANAGGPSKWDRTKDFFKWKSFNPNKGLRSASWRFIKNTAKTPLHPAVYYPGATGLSIYHSNQPYEVSEDAPKADQGMLEDDYIAPSVMNKSGSVLLPIPGAVPAMFKRSNMVAQLANDYYDGRSIQNAQMYKDPYSPAGRLLAGAIKGITGGYINPYQQVSRFDMYLNPRYPVSGANLMQRVVHDTGQTASSNIHTVIGNAAKAKHGNTGIQPTNAATYRPQTTSGRSFATQLSEALN
jgi:hypothetical protein